MVGLNNLYDWLIFMRHLDAATHVEVLHYKTLNVCRWPLDENQVDQLLKCTQPVTVPHASLPTSCLPLVPAHNNHNAYATNRPLFLMGGNADSTMEFHRYLPHLSDEEREILDLHHGYKKCQHCYVQHDGNSCPNDFPDTSSYTPLSHELAAETYKVPGYDTFHGVDLSMICMSKVAPIFTWGPTTHLLTLPPIQTMQFVVLGLGMPDD
jgi:hypothetical protein